MKWYNWRKKFWNKRRAISSWQIHWHASSLTLSINIHAAGQSNGPLLSFLLLYWIAGIGIVIHYKDNIIHSYIQSLNPILKILKFKYLQIRHKPCNQLATKAKPFPRKSSNTAFLMIDRHARDFTTTTTLLTLSSTWRFQYQNNNKWKKWNNS